jgi:flagellar export protein FliJ
MRRSKRLTPIIELTEKQTQAALVKLGEANAAWMRDTQQLNELESYKQEYLLKLRQGLQLSITAQKVLELRRFLTQLDQAIQAQHGQIQNSLKQREYYQAEWVKARSKEQAMNSLGDRYRSQEMQHELKQEQNELDERNTSQWIRQKK